MQKKLEICGEYESGTEYIADRERYDVFLSDCVHIENDIYASGRDSGYKDCGSDMDIAFYLKGKRDITLDFRGATLFLHGRIQPFVFDSCENIIIKNCVVEYDRAFATEMEILESAADYFRVRISDKCPCRIEYGNLVPYSGTWENLNLDKVPVFLQTFDKNTRDGTGIHLVVFGNEPHIDESLPWASSTIRLRASNDGDSVVFSGNALPKLNVGDIAVVGHDSRKYSSVFALDCKNLCLENYRIVNGAGMGIFPMHCENIYIDSLTMTCGEGSPLIHSNEADGIHSVSCKGDFVLKNSVIEGTIDDALNIHGNYCLFVSAAGNKMTVQCSGLACKDYKSFGEGERIAVYKGHTLDKCAEYVILSIETVDDGTRIFTLDRESENHAEGDVIENLSAQTDILFENCRFGKANTHIRLQSRGKIRVRSCTTSLPFLLTGDTNSWFESSPVCDMEVTDTVFEGSRAIVSCVPSFTPSETHPYYHSNLTVRKCRFAALKPLCANYTENIIFEDNVSDKDMQVVLVNCGQAKISGAEEIRKTASDVETHY